MREMAIKRIMIVSKRSFEEVNELSKRFTVRERGDICIAIGGDGTFLEAARKADCPILLIRSGERNSLGFHADARLDELPTVIEKLETGDYYVEKHRKLRITYGGQSYSAVNDAVLFRANPGVIHLKVDSFDERGELEPLFPDLVKGDGVVVSREIGSTAYNYFAHGPIIFGGDIATVTPICANYRFSIVTGRDLKIEVHKNEGSLQSDGVEIGRPKVNDSFTTSRSDELVRIVRLKGMETFSGKLSRLQGF